MPSFLNVPISTGDSITEVCTWQPSSLGSWARAFSAMGSVAALTERAISTSSVWSLGLWLDRKSVV